VGRGPPNRVGFAAGMAASQALAWGITDLQGTGFTLKSLSLVLPFGRPGRQAFGRPNTRL